MCCPIKWCFSVSTLPDLSSFWNILFPLLLWHQLWFSFCVWLLILSLVCWSFFYQAFKELEFSSLGPMPLPFFFQIILGIFFSKSTVFIFQLYMKKSGHFVILPKLLLRAKYLLSSRLHLHGIYPSSSACLKRNLWHFFILSGGTIGQF